MMKPPEGIIPVLVTPIKDGKPDLDSLADLIEWLNGFPLGGYWALGTGSEDHHLCGEYRRTVAHTVLERAKHPVFLGCGTSCPDDSLHFIRTMDNCWPESDFAYHWMPYHPKLSEAQTMDLFDRVAYSTDRSVYGYTSANFTRSIDPAQWKMTRATRAAGLKYSSQRTSDIQKALSLQSDDFGVITAVATQTAACRAMGSKAHTSSVASAVPEMCLRAWSVNYGFENQNDLTALLSSFTGAKKDNFISAAEEKHILMRRGIIETDEVTLGYRRVTQEEGDRVWRKYKELTE